MKTRIALAIMGLAGAIAVAVPARAVDQAIIDAAKKEGEVTWYTTLIVEQFVRPAAAAFEKKYGVKVNYVRTAVNDITLRVTNEARAGKVQADVINGALPAASLRKSGVITNFIPESAKHLPKDYVDADGYWVATNLYVLAPAFNTNLIPRGTEPKTFADLLDPKWRGKIAWSAHNVTGGAAGFIGLVLTEMGETEGLAYLQKLARQNLINQNQTSAQVGNEVMAGEYPIGLQIFTNSTAFNRARGAPIDWIRMEPGMLVLNTAALTAGSPHPNAGKLLLDFLVSQEGQELFREGDFLPANPAVRPRDPSLAPDSGAFRVRTFTPEQLEAAMPQWGEINRRLFRH